MAERLLEAVVETDSAFPMRRGIAPRVIGQARETDTVFPLQRRAIVAPGAPYGMSVLSARAESVECTRIIDTAVAATLAFRVAPGAEPGSITATEHTFTRLYPGPLTLVVVTELAAADALQQFTVKLPKSGLWIWRARARRGAVMGPESVCTDSLRSASGVGFALFSWVAPVSNPQPF